MRHVENCHCDSCIKERVRQRVLAQETDKAVKAYEGRRGGAIGSISVPEALRQRAKR